MKWELRTRRRVAAELVASIVYGLDGALVAGQLESWELLSLLAAGAVPPTAADPQVVAVTQAVWIEVVPIVVRQLAVPDPRRVDYFVIDVLEAVSEFTTGPTLAEVVGALRTFAARGENEAKSVKKTFDQFDS